MYNPVTTARNIASQSIEFKFKKELTTFSDVRRTRDKQIPHGKESAGAAETADSWEEMEKGAGEVEGTVWWPVDGGESGQAEGEA